MASLRVLMLAAIMLGGIGFTESHRKGNKYHFVKKQRGDFGMSINATGSSQHGLHDESTEEEQTENAGSGAENPESSKRALPVAAAAILKNPKVQEAVIEKGIEVAGKLVDKQLQIIDEAQEKAEKFLKKEIKLNIIPEKGWLEQDMFIPPGYHIDSSIGGEPSTGKETGDVPYVYPAGLGNVMMNGCYGRDYKANDPCYNARANSKICLNLIDGAAFIGVGFDGRGKYTSESRKMSIVQRNCANLATYDGFDVPDTMNVHGIYDTSANMYVFEKRSEYQKYLQGEAGISGSYFGFYAGAKAAWGSSDTGAQQKFMSILDINVARYEIFMDEVKPSDLSVQFLNEVTDLPVGYYTPSGPAKYQDFILRWGTHYIKSGIFGGQLEIRKTMDATDQKTKSEFSQEMEAEYKSLFASFAAREKTTEGEYKRVQAKTSSTALVVQGGSQEIASIMSDMYSPTFKSEFSEWLQSIPAYPKAFHFLMSPITDLLNFRESDLFPEKKATWGCEGYETALLTKEVDGEEVKYYEYTTPEGEKEEIICKYEGRKGLQLAIERRRKSLKRAIEVYMEEGPIAISDTTLEACPAPQPPAQPAEENDLLAVTDVPTWKTMTNAKIPFTVIFDMKNDLTGSGSGKVVISRNMNRRVRFVRGKWFTGDENGKFHLYNGFNNGKSGNPKNRKVSILGLILTFNEKDGSLVLEEDDLKEARKVFRDLTDEYKGVQLAQVETAFQLRKRAKKQSDPVPANLPRCVKWSNALRFDTGEADNSRCLHFTASSNGDIYVVFAGVPNDQSTWYSLEIGTSQVSINKGTVQKTKTEDKNAKAIGDENLHQSYFVCITESSSGTLIEYGKSLGTSENGDVYLNYIDNHDTLQIRFYSFGNKDAVVHIMDSHMIARKLTKTTCRLDTALDPETDICVQKCHEACDPLAGCTSTGSGEPQNTECNACRYAKVVLQNGFRCEQACPDGFYPTANKVCKKIFEITTTSDGPFIQTQKVIPIMEEVTACFWIKTNSFPAAGARMIKLHNFLNHFNPSDGGTRGATIEIRISHTSFYITGRWGGDSSWQGIVIYDQMKDFQWHHVCLAYSSLTGLVTSYVDAKKVDASDVGRAPFPGGGRIFASTECDHAVSYTEINFWKRILREAEMMQFAQSCNAGVGDVIEWFDFWHSAEPNTSVYSSDPTCQPAPPPAPAEEAPEPPGSAPAPEVDNDVH